MVNIHHLLLLKTKGFKYLKYNLIAVIIFGLLYWIQDLFITLYPDISKKLYLGKSDGTTATLLYYIWYSLITQTTVGYAGVIKSNGDNVSFNKIRENPFKILNILQLFSIFYIAAGLM